MILTHHAGAEASLARKFGGKSPRNLATPAGVTATPACVTAIPLAIITHPVADAPPPPVVGANAPPPVVGVNAPPPVAGAHAPH